MTVFLVGALFVAGIAAIVWGDIVTLVSLAITIGALLAQFTSALERLNRKVRDISMRLREVEQIVFQEEDDGIASDDEPPH